jgi:hypothetical protein
LYERIKALEEMAQKEASKKKQRIYAVRVAYSRIKRFQKHFLRDIDPNDIGAAQLYPLIPTFSEEDIEAIDTMIQKEKVLREGRGEEVGAQDGYIALDKERETSVASDASDSEHSVSILTWN